MLAAEPINSKRFGRGAPVKTSRLGSRTEKLRSHLSPLSKLCKSCLLKLLQKDALQSGGICEKCLLVIQQWQSLRVKKMEHATPEVPAAANSIEKKNVAESHKIHKTEDAKVTASPRRIILTVKDPKHRPERYSCGADSVYKKLTAIDAAWCRYCGTTEGINWRPGPWGKRTLCNKHGCDYKGYGFASKSPRLDLSAFEGEKITERSRPIIQDYCFLCKESFSLSTNRLLMCHGCPKAYHNRCYNSAVDFEAIVQSGCKWFCHPSCQVNQINMCVKVDLPRKMHFPFLNFSKCDMEIDQDLSSHLQNSTTPSKTPKKRRKSSHYSVSPVFPNSLSKIASHAASKSTIPTPSWAIISSSKQVESMADTEDISDETYIQRHNRYEYTERHTRILRPQTLASLESNSFQ